MGSRNRRSLRRYVYRRDNYTCVYCGNKDRATLTLDHVVPKSLQGRGVRSNMVTACQHCNQCKGDTLIYRSIDRIKAGGITFRWLVG